MISTEKNPRATIIVAIEPKDASPSGDAWHAVASERHPSANRGGALNSMIWAAVGDSCI